MHQEKKIKSDGKDLTKVINAMRETWPTKDGEFITAVFFRHDKDGNVLGCMPLVGEDESAGGYVPTTLLLERLANYLDTLEYLAETIYNKLTNGTKRNGS